MGGLADKLRPYREDPRSNEAAVLAEVERVAWTAPILQSLSPADAEDVVSEVVHRLLAGLRVGQSPLLRQPKHAGALEGFVRTCVRHRGIDLLRKKPREVSLAPETDVPERVPERGSEDRAELVVTIARLLAEMPRHYREVVEWCDVYGRPLTSLIESELREKYGQEQVDPAVRHERWKRMRALLYQRRHRARLWLRDRMSPEER